MSRFIKRANFLCILVLAVQVAGPLTSPALADPCPALLTPPAPQLAPQVPAPAAATLLEQRLVGRLPLLAPEDQLTEVLARLSQSDAALADQVTQARRSKAKGQSLRLDLSALTAPMIAFIEGPFASVVGARGLSRPFVEVVRVDENTLELRHLGDQFPLRVRWSDETQELEPASTQTIEGKVYRVLDLPGTMISRQALRGLHDKYIYSLISASRFNPFIGGAGSLEMTIANLLHNGAPLIERPTQVEAKEVRQLLDTDVALRRKVRSLLFVAPPASGKTRVLGDAILGKVLKAVQNPGSKKLTVLMTRTPDLTSALATEIGGRIRDEIGSSTKCRLIQWGGELSENMSLEQLIRFIESSPVPVVLFSSYPTLAERAPLPTDKARLLRGANALLIDEAHNAGGETFNSMLQAALAIATADRAGAQPLDSLDILGVTASPLTRIQRTVELYDASFWAAIDSPSVWARRVMRALATQEPSDEVLEWARIIEQYGRARDRGEINPAEAIFYRPEANGFAFDTIFKRSATGTHSSVNIERLKEIWRDIGPKIEGHGPGVVQTYPRDAALVAATLSELTGKNCVSLQGLAPAEREQVYRAFKDRSEYRGRRVDAIVGTIREGLDFPEAGWYLSFKKYVKFPENLQGPGRVVRMALDKLPPVIIFFGENIDRIAYQDARDFVLSRLGKLPGRFLRGRPFSGARRGPDDAVISKAASDLNIAMEALLRIHSDVISGPGNERELTPEMISELQAVVRDSRFPERNREIARALGVFVNQLNSYPFFTGELRSTWTLCDRLIALKKKVAEKQSKLQIDAEDLAILKDEGLMERVEQFRRMYAWLGPVPRAILQTIDLRPRNITELAEATNAFVAHNGIAPYELIESPRSMYRLVHQAFQTSAVFFWGKLDFAAQTALAEKYDDRWETTLESALEEYFAVNRALPVFNFDLIEEDRVLASDVIAGRMARDLAKSLKDGSLNVDALSPDLRKALDQSAVLTTLTDQTLLSIGSLREGLGETLGAEVTRIADEGLLTYDNLKRIGDFRVLRVIERLADLKLSACRERVKRIEQALQ